MSVNAHKRLISVLTSFLLVINSLVTPFAYVYADELSETAPAVEEAPLEITESQTEETVLEVDEQLAEDLTETQEATMPAEEVQVEEVESAITDEVQLEATLLYSIETSSLNEFDLNYDTSEGSATLVTDKEDYAPNEVVVLTGAGLPKNSVLFLRVIWPDGLVRNSQGNVDQTDLVVTDETGSFMFLYDLRGEGQEGGYVVEVLMDGVVVSSTTFTDSHLPTHLCQSDTAGANDEPGQKDLTQMCADYSGLDEYIEVDWNWDDTSWSGNNTGDACALFDNDGDGLVDYAVCVTVGGSPATQVSGSPRLYTCNNTKPDRCAGSTLILGPYTTTCTVGQSNDDPFPTGNNYPNDTKASCTISLGEVGGENDTVLTDVCSFPSQQPNSDPSDCIIARSKAARLEIIKEIVPSTDSGLFNLLIDGQIYKTDASNGDTTGEISVDVGNNGKTVTVSETSGSNTSLSSYTTSIQCRDLNGTGAIVASSSTTSVSVSLVDQDDVVCRIKNELQKGSLTVTKVLIPSDDTGKFNLLIDGDTYASNVGDGGTTDAVELQAGDYQVSETAGTSTNLNNYTSVFGGDCDEQGNVTLAAGENKTCTITNTRKSTLTVNKVLIPDSDNGLFNLRINGDTYATNVGNNGTTGAVELSPDTYTVSETAGTATNLGDYTAVIGGDCASDGTVTLGVGEQKTCTITNTKKATIIVKKVMTGGTGSFTFTSGVSALNGSINTNNGTLQAQVVPGKYTATESIATGWALTNITCDDDNSYGETSLAKATFNADAGDVVTCTFTNTKLNSISGMKFEDKNGNGVKDVGDNGLSGWTINLSGNANSSTTTDSDGNYSFTGLTAGTYTVCEVLKAGWTQTYPDDPDCHTVELAAGEDATNQDFGNFKNVTIKAYKFEDMNGNGVKDPEDLVIANWSMTLNGGQVQNTDSEGMVSWTVTTGGDFTVAEESKTGWTHTSPSSVIVSIQSGDADKVVEFLNFKNVIISGYKFGDLDDDGVWDQQIEQGLAGWTITLGGDGSDSVVTDSDGYYEFTNLAPGTYTLCETLQNDWIQTFPTSGFDCGDSLGYSIAVSSGQNEDDLNFGNMEVISGLEIQKSNTKSGQLVNYTIVVTNTGNHTLIKVEIIDALPGGFTYIAGTSKLDGNPVSDPTLIGGALVWEIEDFAVGSKTLTYQVQIADGLVDGIYTNIAYARGISRREQTLTTTAVSSEVELGSSTAFGGSISPQVLGISTELPATGSPTGTLLAISTLGIIGYSLRKRSQKYEN